MIKKIATAVVGMGLVLATVVPAFAVNQCGNQTTGSGSFNLCTRLNVKTKTFTLGNYGTITHNITATSVSGNNTASNNTGNSTTGGGIVIAGAVGHAVLKQASLNTSNLTVSQTDPTDEEQGVNDTTGATSNNTVTFTTNKTLTLNVTNNGTVSQTVNSIAQSGGNNANNNTLGGSITTGAVTHDVSVISILNDTILNITQ